jgi:hypothetical protein
VPDVAAISLVTSTSVCELLSLRIVSVCGCQGAEGRSCSRLASQTCASAWTATFGGTVAPAYPEPAYRSASTATASERASATAFVFGAAFAVVVVMDLVLTGIVLSK